MNPKNSISGINSFLNKQFGLPLPNSSSSTKGPLPGLGGINTPNMSYAPKTNQNMSYANPSSTNPAPAVIKPPVVKKKNILPPAANTFIENQKNSVITPQVIGAGTPQVSGIETPVNTNIGTSTETLVPPKAPESPYLTYLRSMFDPEALKTANTKMGEDVSRLTGIQNESAAKELEARRLYEAKLDEPGGLVSGARESAALSARRSNSELADLALRESAAARTAGVSRDIYDQMIGAGKSVYEAEQAQAKADQENTRYIGEQDYKKEQDTIKNEYNTKVFDENKRQFGLEYALEQQKANAPKALTAAQEAKQIADEEKKLGAEQSATQTIGVINNLLSGDRYKAISGGTQTGMIPFFGDRAAVAEYKQLTGLLKLGIRGMIKGQGAVSDYEGKILGEASSALSRMTSEKQMKQALQKVRGVLKTNNGGDTQVIIRDSEGNTLGQGLLNGKDIYDAVNDGNTIEYL